MINSLEALGIAVEADRLNDGHHLSLTLDGAWNVFLAVL